MKSSLMWFRRDLRLDDNAALFHACRNSDRVYCCFCFDTEILDKLEDKADRRVQFIHQSLSEIVQELRKHNSELIVRLGKAREEIPRLAADLGIDSVYANHDYEPKCMDRDRSVEKNLAKDGRSLHTFKDHVVFEKCEVVGKTGQPLKVYTPYRNAWRARLTDDDIQPFSSGALAGKLAPPLPGVTSCPWTLADLGFQETDLNCPAGARAANSLFGRFLTIVHDYGESRDVPGIDGTSRLSVHLRFGTISIRSLICQALEHGSAGAQKWVDELIWRDFYNMILYHFPHTEERAFQPLYDNIAWRHDRKQFDAWRLGRTGYPIVDAGMRQLNQTGYMHNRLRMITASFLTKDLRIDWKWGERYFASKLLDYDLSQNLGGWQWSASIGTDAQPYFRIFNPVAQSERFDPDGEYIRRFVPELAKMPAPLIHAPWNAGPLDQEAFGCILGKDYPSPIVRHDEARKAALEMFKSVRQHAAKPGRRPLTKHT